MSDYKSRIPDWENDRLNTILKKFYDKKLNIASYDEFSGKVRDEKKNRDIETIIKQTKTELNNLSVSLKSETKNIVSELNSLMYPNISKDVNLSGEKTFGETEFRNAIEIYKIKPKNIDEILKLAIEQKRFDFVFFTFDFYLKDTDLPIREKMKIQFIYDELGKQLGFTEKQEKKNQLERYLVEVEDQLELIDESPERFEANVMTSIKVAQRMFEAGQLGAETMLLK